MPLEEARAFTPGELVIVDTARSAGYLACTVVRTAACQGHTCGELIVWVRTPMAAMLPCDPGLGEEAGTQAQPLTSHWTSCPDADQFRRPKGPSR